MRWRVGLCEFTEGWNFRFVGLDRGFKINCVELNSLRWKVSLCECTERWSLRFRHRRRTRALKISMVWKGNYYLECI